MAYSAVSTVSDGDVFSASQLNGIINNQQHFYSMIGESNVPAFTAQDTALDGIYGTWYMRYTKRYLHYYIEILTGDVDRMKISVNGNFEFDDGTNRTSGYIYTGYIDITGITSVPSSGAFYPIYVDVTHLSPSGGTCRIWYFIHSDQTVL